MSKIAQLSLRKNFSWNFLGSLVYSFSQFFILILLAKLGNPTLVGLYSIGLAITAPIIMLTNLQLRQIQATDTSSEYTFCDYMGMRIITSIFAILLTFVVIGVGSYSMDKAIIIILVGFTKIIDSFSDVVYGQLQQRERMDYIGKSRIIKGLVTIFTIAICMFLTQNLFLSLIVLNITWLFIFVLYDLQNVKLFVNKTVPIFKIGKMKSLFILAFPLGIVLMLGSLNTNLPRILVENFLGTEALGYFASISYLLVVGNTFIQSVGQATSPRLAKLYYNNNINVFLKILSLLVLFAIGIGLAGISIAVVIGEEILSFIFEESFKNYNYLLILTMVASVFTFSSSFLGYSLTAMRLFKIQPFIAVFGLIVTLIFCLILIPQNGLIGATVVLIINGCIQVLIKFVIVIMYLKSKKLRASNF